MNAERRMKDSHIPWIGLIPEHWETKPLKRYISIKKGVKPAEFTNIPADYPYLTMDYIRGREDKLILYPVNTKDLVLINKNEILVLWDGANAGEYMLSKEGYLGSTMAYIRLVNDVYDKSYFFYLLKNLEKASKDFANGTTIPHFDSDILLKYSYPIPPLEEQERIAGWLDEKCGVIDELIEVEQKMIKELEAYRQAIITETVTRGLNPEAPLRPTSIPWLPLIPEHWVLTNVKFYSTFYNGDRTSRYPQPSELLDSGIPFLTSRNINGNIVDISVNETKYISKEKYQSLGGAKLQLNDIVYCLRGSIGKCALNQKLNEGTVASSLMVIRPQNIYPLFLLFYLLSDTIKEQTFLFMNGTCAANLSAESVGNFSLILPPLAEQQEIADYLDRKCRDIDELMALKREKIDTLKEYRQSLIFEAVTGKISIK